ncbi:MAG: HEAT repeat domain-containing protein, partial [Polyangiaceae bacterium]
MANDINLDMAMKPRSNKKPLIIIVILLLAAAGIGAVVLGGKFGAAKMTVAQRMEIQKNIFVLPKKDQIPKWRLWAGKEDASDDLRAEALVQLALLEDPEGVKLAMKALATGRENLSGVAAQVLAFYGSPAANPAKAALNAALKDASMSVQRHIVWALVELGDQKLFAQAMVMYRSGRFGSLETIEGNRAFNPVKITNLVSLDKLAAMAGDESSAVRQLIATILSANAEKKWTATLVKLVNDQDISVAREAASGLGKIADPKARNPLLDALRKADKDSRLRFIEALRDGIGGAGLVLALDTVATEPEARNWFQTRQLFDMIHALKDPRVGDELVAWVERTKPHVHWQTETGIALAEVGDIRGAKFLGERMGKENKDLYIKEKFWQADKGGHMTRNDKARVVGSRMLADLAILYPDKLDELRAVAAEPVLTWLTSRPQPHANGLRFPAASEAEIALPKMRAWAFPDDKLPNEGAQPPFPHAFETAQSGLRYIGWMRDPGSLPKLIKQFDRKDDDKMDITQQGLMGAGRAMLGMALRAVTYGASNGLAQWGAQKDSIAEDKLIEFIEDELWHEEARMQACRSLAWIAKDDTMKKIVEKVGEFAKDIDPRKQFIAACYAETLALRPVPDAVGMMVDLITPDIEVGLRNRLGHAIGVTGLKGKDAEREKLFKLLDDAETRNAAALALILGG